MDNISSWLFALLPSHPTNLLLIVMLLVAAAFLLVIIVVVVLAAGSWPWDGGERSGMNASNQLSHPRLLLIGSHFLLMTSADRVTL